MDNKMNHTLVPSKLLFDYSKKNVTFYAVLRIVKNKLIIRPGGMIVVAISVVATLVKIL